MLCFGLPCPAAQPGRSQPAFSIVCSHLAQLAGTELRIPINPGAACPGARGNISFSMVSFSIVLTCIRMQHRPANLSAPAQVRIVSLIHEEFSPAQIVRMSYAWLEMSSDYVQEVFWGAGRSHAASLGLSSTSGFQWKSEVPSDCVQKVFMVKALVASLEGLWILLSAEISIRGRSRNGYPRSTFHVHCCNPYNNSVMQTILSSSYCRLRRLRLKAKLA